MAKDSKFLRIMNFLKLFTYISATILLITNNSYDKLTYLIPLVLLLIFVSYFREYYLVVYKKSMTYIWTSIIFELVLAICIGLFDQIGVNMLFFYVCISTTIIIYPFIYSVPLAIFFIASEFLVYAEKNGLDNLNKSMISLLFSYGVSTIFVMVMSYIVKNQIREKEKLAHINAELELAYTKLIENSAVTQRLSVEQERTRMAREIHDTLAHTLTTLIVQLEACKKLALLDSSRLPSELEKAQELSRSGFNDVKRTIKALRPQIMEDKSFIASITSVINECMENTKVHIKLDNLLPIELNLEAKIEVTIFRLIQESITNSIRHGQASEIVIHMEQNKNMLHLCIFDNGNGCSNIKKGFGIQGIKERIENLNGSAEFSSSIGKGFKTMVSIPIEGA